MTNISQDLDILRPFTQRKARRIHASEIARIVKKPQKTVQRRLERLNKKGLLEYEIVGKNKQYFFDLKKISSLALLNMIETNKEVQFLVNHQPLTVLFNELAAECSVMLFGSYAKAKEKDGSDLDLIIFGRKNKKSDAAMKRFPIEINAEYSSMNAFERRLNQRQPLAVEIAENHIIFGKKDDIIRILFKRS